LSASEVRSKTALINSLRLKVIIRGGCIMCNDLNVRYTVNTLPRQSVSRGRRRKQQAAALRLARITTECMS
jgi:hypothetical protein